MLLTNPQMQNRTKDADEGAEAYRRLHEKAEEDQTMEAIMKQSQQTLEELQVARARKLIDGARVEQNSETIRDLLKEKEKLQQQVRQMKQEQSTEPLPRRFRQPFQQRQDNRLVPASSKELPMPDI